MVPSFVVSVEQGFSCGLHDIYYQRRPRFSGLGLIGLVSLFNGISTFVGYLILLAEQ